ncbi:MAG: PLP-dependent aspartate aminotransferase family protein [Prevotellaceae bacterium]|jgi:cystathionine gamma-lyase|nr:PLP-dependent aspartate aminotransferase family protein [Prevotellaceae bacterium]
MENPHQHYGFETLAIRAGEPIDLREGATADAVAAIHLASTFGRQHVARPGQYEYIRMQNPTREALEVKLAALENAKYGLAFSSGSAAQSTLMLALLKAGDHIVAFDDLYGGTKRIFAQVFQKFGISVSYADATMPEAVEQAVAKNTKMLWLETPTNPLMKIADIRAIADIAHRHNLTLVVDNTFLSPYFQRPLDLGADVVLHSLTKYIGGHSDVLGGALLLNNDELHDELVFFQNSVGAVMPPFDAYLTMRGLKTLAMRMEQHQHNALIVAQYLEQHPRVRRVLYAGLPSHPQYALARQQASGFGGVISFEMHGQMADATRFLERLKVVTLAESLGGVESLAELPCLMTHASMSQAEREKVGISDTLIRISVGVENINDLLADIEQALS